VRWLAVAGCTLISSASDLNITFTQCEKAQTIEVQLSKEQIYGFIIIDQILAIITQQDSKLKSIRLKNIEN